MASTYPSTLDAFSTSKQDDTDAKTGADQGVSSTVGDHATHHNDLADAVIKVETELGTLPKGSFATAKERFEAADWKQSCRASTTAPLPAATYAAGPPATLTANANGALASQDGVTLVAGDRLFVKDQTAPAQNGIYKVTHAGNAGLPWILTRTEDADSAVKLSDAMYVAVQQGAKNADTTWELISDNPITLGTTALRYTRVLPAYADVFMNPWAPSANAVKQENMRRDDAAANISPLSSGRVNLFGGFVLKAGVPYNGIAVMSGTTGAGTPTHQWFAFVRLSDRVYLRSTVNDTTTAWAAAALKPLALSSQLVLDVDTPVWVAVMVAATTVPSLMGKTNTLSANINGLAPILSGTSDTGQTTPKTDGFVAQNPTADRNMPYIALY